MTRMKQQPSHTITLYRSATSAQIAAIAKRGWSGFGAESLIGGYFYPMLHRDYARLVAQYWNAHQYGEGFVLACRIRRDWLSQFEPHTIATSRQLEYRIPAATLPAFNRQLYGTIRVLRHYRQTAPLLRPMQHTSLLWNTACPA